MGCYTKKAASCLTVSMMLAACLLWPVSLAAQQSGKKQRAKTVPPANAAALQEAAAHLQAGRLREAEVVARQMIKDNPRHADAHSLLGVILDQQQQIAAAENEYRTALRLNPNLVSALSNLGVLLARTQRAGEAITTLEKVVRLAPAHPQANFNLGFLYAAQGDYTKAIAPLEKVADNEDPSVALLLVNAYFRVGRKADALNRADKIAQAAVDDAAVLFNLGLTLAEAAEYERAAHAFARTDEIRPNTAEVLYNLGIARYNLDRLDEAAQSLNTAAVLAPNTPEIFYRLGLVESARGRSVAAIDQWLRALTLRNTYPEANFLIAEELVKNKRNEQALEFYERAVQQDPEKFLYYVRWAAVRFRAKQYEEARDIFLRAQEKFPAAPELHYFIGMAARGAGNYDVAESELKKALAAQPNNADALAHLGFIAVERDQPQEAERILRQVISMSADHFPAHYDLGRLFVRTKRYAEALPFLQKGAELSPNDPGVHYQLFLAFSRLKRKEEAEKELKIFRGLQPENKQDAEPDKNATLPTDLPNVPQVSKKP